MFTFKGDGSTLLLSDNYFTLSIYKKLKGVCNLSERWVPFRHHL